MDIDEGRRVLVVEVEVEVLGEDGVDEKRGNAK